MISVNEALAIIEANIVHAEPVQNTLENSYESILAQDILSPIDMPPFKQSSMDGYAVRLSESDQYKVVGEIQAGTENNIHLNKGEAVRIFTGALVPATADTVVMQEHVSRTNDSIKLTQKPAKGANVRPQGEQLKKGELALSKGTILNAAALGFLSGLGLQQLTTFRKPSISILITGNELQQPGTPLANGQVYDSNSVSLKFALLKLGITNISIDYIPDDYQRTYDKIKTHLNASDMILISGGISVGDYDFVKDALIENQVSELFYKVNQKPGKPLWFGRKNEKIVFALPGNPASSLSCMYVYVLPAVRKYMGYATYHLTEKTAISTQTITNRSAKHLFLKGTVQGNKAIPLLGQASSMLKSFATSNALLMIPETVGEIKKGEPISYLDLNS